MMTVSMTCDFAGDRVLSRLLSSSDMAGERIASAVLSDSTPYVPYDTGALCGSGHIAKTGDGWYAVIWDVPYARAVYYGDARGVSFHTDAHPLASARWTERARAVCREKWTDEGRRIG
ncbi:MAG: hypothetical protein IJ449_10275 [Clostridia bacterium]|nr:hypothetical protein [Clostridia bacterium]